MTYRDKEYYHQAPAVSVPWEKNVFVYEYNYDLAYYTEKLLKKIETTPTDETLWMLVVFDRESMGHINERTHLYRTNQVAFPTVFDRYDRPDGTKGWVCTIMDEAKAYKSIEWEGDLRNGCVENGEIAIDPEDINEILRGFDVMLSEAGICIYEEDPHMETVGEN